MPLLRFFLSWILFLILGSFLDPATEDQRVNFRVETLTQLAKENDVDFWADEVRCRQIVQFQDLAAQTRVFIERCRKMMGMVYKTMFPRNPQPEEFTGLLEKFKDIQAVLFRALSKRR
jgi:hypothetical protein